MKSNLRKLLMWSSLLFVPFQPLCQKIYPVGPKAVPIEIEKNKEWAKRPHHNYLEKMYIEANYPMYVSNGNMF